MADIITITYEGRILFEASTDAMLDLQILKGSPAFSAPLKGGIFDVFVRRQVNRQSFFRRLFARFWRLFSL